MTFAATLHEIAADWALTASESGWIGGIYFAGYAIAVPFLASASDRMDGRWLDVGCALLGAAASFAFAAFADGFAAALVLGFFGGIGLAGVHMPGLNLLMDRIERSLQGRAAGIYTSSYAAGSAGVVFDRWLGRCRIRLAGHLHRRSDRAIVVDLHSCPAAGPLGRS
jgi:MFS family permease